MKKLFHLGLTFMLLLALAACASSPEQAKSSTTSFNSSETTVSSSSTSETTAASISSTETTVPETESAAILEFSDKALEDGIRDAMNKPAGDVTADDAALVTVLNLANKGFDDMNSKNGGVKDISALRYFTELRELDLSFNDIHDLSPLAELENLETLVFNGTSVEDLSPLQDLTNMNLKSRR